jgi:hypothetical protein
MSKKVTTMSRERIEELKEQIADLKKRWPAHSIPVAMMEQLDELEEELARELRREDGSAEVTIMLSKPAER